MRDAARAYTTTARQTASPRDLEADLLLKAASRLQALKDAWGGRCGALDDALLYNRRLWSVFLSSATSDDNPLPTEVRQNIANLGLFVMKQTVSMLSDPRPEHLDPLISINCELAAGLRGSK